MSGHVKEEPVPTNSHAEWEIALQTSSIWPLSKRPDSIQRVDRHSVSFNMAQLLIHGTLNVTINKAEDLKRKRNSNKRSYSEQSKNKLYATIDLDETRIIEDQQVNPGGSFHIYCAHQAAKVVVKVKNGNSNLGCANVPVKDLLDGKWHELLNDEDREPFGGRIRVKLQYLDVSGDSNWGRGIGTPKFPGVPYTFYTQRMGCKVTLYQDAHMPDNFMPHISLAGGQVFQPQRCWQDVFDAIENARHLIYITGWSVYTEITLIRDSRRSKPGGDQTLGQLLKKKAEEGVRVLMLVWKDRTSVKVLYEKGFMDTHGRETFNYFQGTKVRCVLCPRNPDDDDSCWVDELVDSITYTHHQKIVVTDGPLPGRGSNERRIVSFVGGIDLCDGRYDTQVHSLFRTLDSAHKKDFHQPSIDGACIEKGGPREPWHDIHCKLEGQIAWDVFSNFEDRWRKQGDKDVLLLPLGKIGEIIPPSPVTDDEDHETWHVQLFRSIDGEAAVGFPDTPDKAAESGLVCKEDNIIDRGIQDAYIHAIRRAKKFIYIENQYFLGSSYGWKQVDGNKVDDKAAHLIPKELSLKIVSKIEAEEPFRVYVVLPMWPEGEPDSAAMQAILDCQWRTMEMMYADIAKALRAKGINDGNPRDYLTFFCLANREVKREGEYMPTKKPKKKSDYKRAQDNRRFMIYVHSKMMIVDDEYIIVGSANLNQRSMDGARDTEIAMGGYQPHHLAAQEPARGQIHGFRMSLWYEHTGVLDDLFREPQSIECIQKMNKIGNGNWDLYSSDALEHDLPGHLLMYPVVVTNDGDVTELPGFENFPDTKAPVLGTKSPWWLPDKFIRRLDNRLTEKPED